MVSVNKKLLGRFSLFFLVVTVVMIFETFNLQVSYKYEVDHMETFITVDEQLSEKDKNAKLSEVEKTRLKIVRAQQIIEMLLWFSVAGFAVAGSMWTYKWLKGPA